MKKIHYPLLMAYYLFLATPSLFGQQKPCNNYACVIEKIERLLKQPQKDYKAILDNLDSAEGYPDNKPEQLRTLRRRVFVAIEKEKEEAKKARDDAKKQTEIAKAAEAKAKAVLDKIYFYDDKFGLAYDKEKQKYGFIDKNLQTKIKFQYEAALPFDFEGFAKVSRLFADFGSPTNQTGETYLIDTFGLEYKIAYDTTALQYDTLVEALDLWNQGIENLPQIITANSTIKILKLGTNNLKSLPNGFMNLEDLVYLDLSDNDIKLLSDDFGKLNKLRILKLSSNQLTHLPQTFSQLSSLSRLDLRYNQLTALPKDFGNLSNLSFLLLMHNNLQKLPDDIYKLQNLKRLYLGSNQLTTLPTTITKMRNLTYIDLASNPISKEEQENIKKMLPNCKIRF